MATRERRAMPRHSKPDTGSVPRPLFGHPPELAGRKDNRYGRGFTSNTWSRILGGDFPIRDLKLASLQDYADRRSREKTAAGKRISAVTIRKEILTLGAAWNWGVQMELVDGRYPTKGLRYAKIDEKPPFQTRDQIERRIAAGGLKPEQIRELWHALYLQVARDCRAACRCPRARRPSLDLSACLRGGAHRGQAQRAGPHAGSRRGLRRRARDHP